MLNILFNIDKVESLQLGLKILFYCLWPWGEKKQQKFWEHIFWKAQQRKRVFH